jgi:predicted RNA-binding protein Jag
MEIFEFEGKTYEEAVKKACVQLAVEERDLDIDVKEVDTKGILGLLGTKKIRITVRLRSEVTVPPDPPRWHRLKMPSRELYRIPQKRHPNPLVRHS